MSARSKWIRRYKTWIAPTPMSGVWEHREGGHLVRSRVVDPATGRMKEIKKVLRDADFGAACQWLETERARIAAGLVRAPAERTRFGDYARALLERKVALREIRSAKSRERWRYTLSHLIDGTTGDQADRYVPGFGDFFIDKLRPVHVEEWKMKIAGLIAEGDFAPSTTNSWLSVLRVIAKAAKREFGLSELATEGVTNFDTSECATYTEEEPCALLPQEVPPFLTAMRELFPQHYAMVFLGLTTGLRPSSLRPLRRQGPMADVLWEERRILVRRSQTRGDEVMNTTKQLRRYSIHVPEELVTVLRWHVETQLTTPEQQSSELLFPAITGGFRAPSVLNKPFAEVSEVIGLGKHLSQRALRRTFNDLARAAAVQSLVTRSISGHLTERMQEHYSTVSAAEQCASIEKVIGLITVRSSLGSALESLLANPQHDAPMRSASGAPELGVPPRSCAPKRVETRQLDRPSGAPGGAPTL